MMLKGLLKFLGINKELTRDDETAIYDSAVRELYKGQDELGSMGELGDADNPYFIELLNEYPGFYNWEKRLDHWDSGYQKHGLAPRMLHKGYDTNRWMDRFEEAKKDTNYYKQSTMDSLIQAYNFDKLKKR